MDDRPRWRWRDARLRPWLIDGLLGVAVAAIQLLMLALGVNQDGPVPYTRANALTVLLILAQGLPLAWRRRRPLVVFGVVLAANTAYYAVAFPQASSTSACRSPCSRWLPSAASGPRCWPA